MLSGKNSKHANIKYFKTFKQNEIEYKQYGYL